jgi:hypothetical protein
LPLEKAKQRTAVSMDTGEKTIWKIKQACDMGNCEASTALLHPTKHELLIKLLPDLAILCVIPQM